MKYFEDMNRNILEEIIKLIYNWLIYQDNDDLIELMNIIPKDILNLYTKYYENMYRGMIILSTDSLYNVDYCSYSRDIKVAESFREKECLTSRLYYEGKQGDFIIDSLYSKSGLGFNLTDFYLDICKCLENNCNENEFEMNIVESLGLDDIEDIIDTMRDMSYEEEIISSFNVDEIKILDALKSEIV